MSEINLSIIQIVALLIFSALVSCFETSITAASQPKIHRLKKEGKNRAKIVDILLKDREKVVNTMLISNNITNIIASAITTKVLLNSFGEIGLIYATAVLTVVVIVFGEILPKNYAIRNAENIVITCAPFIYLIFKTFFPIIFILEKVVNYFFAKNDNKTKKSELKEIRDTIYFKAKQGAIFKYDKDLLGGVLDLSEIEISEIMVHRKNIISLNINLPIEDIVNFVTQNNYTRIPLWEGNKENVIAILNVRKLLKMLHSNNKDYQKIDLKLATSEPWFVPATNSLRSQLFSFHKHKKRFALVVNEYGSLLGLITVEDILEEIVGEIKEQQESIEDRIVKISGESYAIAGKTLIRDINKKLKWNIKSDDNAYNLAAFIINYLGRIPEENENFLLNDYYFEVLKRKGNDLVNIKVKQVKKNEN